MTKTRAELVTRALHKLGAVAAGQSPATEDAQMVDAEVEPIMEDLAQRNIYVWGDPDQIDDMAFVHLADILANSVARDFGVAPDETARLSAEKRLKLLQPPIYSRQVLRTEYF